MLLLQLYALLLQQCFLNIFTIKLYMIYTVLVCCKFVSSLYTYIYIYIYIVYNCIVLLFVISIMIYATTKLKDIGFITTDMT